MAMLLRDTPPVMRCAARFHHHVGGSGLREEACEARTIEPLPSHEPPLRIRERQFEHGLCEVDGHCRSLHLGLLLVALMGVSCCGMMPHRNREESIPSW
jgi:hypothetical protein